MTAAANVGRTESPNMHARYFNLVTYAFVAALFSGCTGDKPADVKEASEGSSSQVAAPAELPTIPSNPSINPSGATSAGEVYVSNSVPVTPGTSVAIISSGPPRQLLVSNAKVTSVRWKVPGPFQSPKYPASEFVGFSLASNQWQAIQDAGDVTIQPND